MHKIPSHIRHVVTAPKKRKGKGYRFPYVVECKCGWSFIGKTAEVCEGEGTKHLNEHTDENGDS